MDMDQGDGVERRGKRGYKKRKRDASVLANSLFEQIIQNIKKLLKKILFKVLDKVECATFHT